MIGWRDGEGGLCRGTLFGVFAALARGEAWSFPALRSHQREPWHMFTVQVAAQALIGAERDDLPPDEATWRDLLIALTPGQPDGEAWALVVDDWSQPALLQPPLVAAANRADYKSRLPTPDALDMLVTSRNHDVKQERMMVAGEEEWLFALVTLQTTEGFLGAGNYGISRMNGGFATRMSLGIRPSGGGAAGEFRRDVRRLVADARAKPVRKTGIGLLWLEPWDGTRQLGFGELDELYVEICRRIRLCRTPAGIEALAAGSKVARVASNGLGGHTGDPWAPITIDTNKTRDTFGKPISVSPGAGGFGYRQMARLLNPEKVTAPLLAKPHQDDDATGLAIVAAALVRGQGKTEGLHRRRIRVNRTKEHDPQTLLDVIGRVSSTRAGDASEAANKLKIALLCLFQSAPAEPSSKKKRLNIRSNDSVSEDRARVWRKQYDNQVDKIFFDNCFWREVFDTSNNTSSSKEEVTQERKIRLYRKAWRKKLGLLAFKVINEAVESAPRTEMRRVRAKARTMSLLRGMMANWIKEIA